MYVSAGGSRSSGRRTDGDEGASGCMSSRLVRWYPLEAVSVDCRLRLESSVRVAGATWSTSCQDNPNSDVRLRLTSELPALAAPPTCSVFWRPNLHQYPPSYAAYRRTKAAAISFASSRGPRDPHDGPLGGGEEGWGAFTPRGKPLCQKPTLGNGPPYRVHARNCELEP